ncbi:MAG: DUF3168 domain-containing protein [Novosphingobium sp.]|nr:DUF3168 domain-containing protein [Novosphingobium sp.]
MSAVAIVRALLAGHAPLLALVPAARIFAGAAPQGAELPLVSVTRVYGEEISTVARRQAGKTMRTRVQVTVLVKDPGGYAASDKILKAAALGAGVHTGNVLSYHVKAILPYGEGPDLPVGDDKIHEKSRDFMVTYSEPI